MTNSPVLIFDLDGTLIDSAPSILSSFAMALEEAGTTPRVPLESGLIGPPLLETLKRLTGFDDPRTLHSYVESFKRHYDGGGYRETTVYPDVAEMLTALQRSGVAMLLATNKRLAPTRLILEYLGWDTLFQAVYTLDAYTPALPNKGALLKRLLTERAILPEHALYIGDRLEDGEAAFANQLPFALATWGYGGIALNDSQADWQQLSTPMLLVQSVCG